MTTEEGQQQLNEREWWEDQDKDSAWVQRMVELADREDALISFERSLVQWTKKL